MQFQPGETIGRYVIESLLGEGGMGEVYRARDPKLDRSVALKIQRKGRDESVADWEHAVQRMQREARAVAALSHPGIVAIYDIGEHNATPFIAMELVAGQPLRNLIGKDQSTSTRLRILLDVTRALGAAHEAGFVHRDIKPENILVRPDGMAKVLDFGIARRTPRHVDPTAPTLDVMGATMEAGSMGMTADGAIVGTPAYMSPEQLRGKTADARSDQFAWGVVAYELLSGQHPFASEDAGLQTIAAILADSPKPLEDVPAGIVQAIHRALEKDPNKRWESMQEIVTLCEAFVTGANAPLSSRLIPGENVSPGQTGTTQKQGSPARSRWLPLVGLALLVGAVILALRFRSPPSASVTAVPSARATSTATAVTELELPVSTNAEALSAFREGLQNIRDAQWTAAGQAFQRARTADPAMAAAHLRFSVIEFRRDIENSREAYRKALSLRATLSERDQGFLHALEPFIMRSPSEFDEAARRFEKLVAKYPNDAEFVFWEARMVIRHDSSPTSLQRVVQLNARCIELDRHYADCWQTKANALIALGRPEDAAVALNECINVSEQGSDCLVEEINLYSHMGRCDSIVKLVQRLKTKDPRAFKASILLAQALYMAGESELVVRAALLDAEEQARKAEQTFNTHLAKLILATDFGDLDGALEQAGVVAHLPIPNIETELELYFLRGVLYLDAGKMTEAAQLADEYIVAQTLRSANSQKVQVDPMIYMRMLQLRAGKISPVEYQGFRSAWIDKQTATSARDRALIWYNAYAAPAYSEKLAEEALAAIPADLDQGLLVGLRATSLINAARGRVLFLARKPAEAIPHLEQATKICTGTELSPWYIQDLAWLGHARDATGDKAGACAAYGRALTRWAQSKQSETIKDVTKRAKTLGCASKAGP